MRVPMGNVHVALDEWMAGSLHSECSEVKQVTTNSFLQCPVTMSTTTSALMTTSVTFCLLSTEESTLSTSLFMFLVARMVDTGSFQASVAGQEATASCGIKCLVKGSLSFSSTAFILKTMLTDDPNNEKEHFNCPPSQFRMKETLPSFCSDLVNAEEKVGNTLERIGTGDHFLNITPRTQTLSSATINQWDYVKLRSFCVIVSTLGLTAPTCPNRIEHG
ncbi:hypothetical protein STEG23_003606, partial [Scotinomys teguina]